MQIAPGRRLYPSTLSAKNNGGMADIINLRLARKQKARRDKDQQAAENRALHGRSKAEREKSRAEVEQIRTRVEAHRRETPGDA